MLDMTYKNQIDALNAQMQRQQMFTHTQKLEMRIKKLELQVAELQEQVARKRKQTQEEK